MNKSAPKYLAFALLGCLIGVLTMSLLPDSDTVEEEQTDSNEPLYWVAPMDASYRRDKPGKSPMGMDLVPVYANQQANSPGTVRIAPNVVHNLGVRTASVQFAPLQQEVKTVGYVQYNEDKLVHIHPRVEGWIDELYVKASGDEVTLNQPLYTLYSPQLINAQEEYLLATSRNNTALINAAIARLIALQMPQQAIDALQKTRKVTQTIAFHSPQSGVVDNLNIRKGFYVEPGNTLMSIGALDEVWVEAEVFERFASLVQVGQSVTMTLGYLPGREWLGKVDYLYPSLNEKTRTVRARLRFDNPGLVLRPNMFAQVVFQVSSDQRTLQIPLDAAIRTGKQDRVVLSLGDGEFKSIEVKLGQVSGSMVEVLSGLQEDDEVVVSAQFLLDSESSVDSDFIRMQPHDMHHHMDHEKVQVESATVKGVLNSIDTQARHANISRDAIEQWQRGPATLDFTLEETLETSDLVIGQTIQFTFEIRDGDFVITDIQSLEGHQHD